MSSLCVSNFRRKTFPKTLNEMRKSSEGTDFVIICNSRKFPVHKIILSSGSSYFRNLFRSCFEESSLEMNNIDPDIMKLILDFLYLNFEEADSSNSIKFTALLAAAYKFDIHELCEYCWQKLLGKLSVKSYLHLWNMALQYDKSSIIEEVLTFIVSHLYEIMKGQSFYEMSFSQMEKLVKKIESLEIPMEVFIMERIINWVQNNEEERTPHLSTLMTHLSITTLPPKYLKELMTTEPLITKDEGLRFIMNKKLKEKPHCHTREEYRLMESYQFLRFVNQVNNSRYQYIDLYTGQKSEDNLSFPLTKGMSCSQSEEFTYFVGGKSADGSCYSNTFIRFCLETNTAEYLLPIPKPVSFAHTCVVNSIFYVVAGTEVSQCASPKFEIIQYYNPATDKWSEIGFPNKILQVKLCANLDKSLFILCEKEKNCFQWYKVNESMKCVFENQMPYALSLSASLSTAYNDHLYSFVTCQNQNLLCIYCCTTKKWTTNYFEGRMPDFVYCALRMDKEYSIFCLSKEEVYVLNSHENAIRPLMINSTFNLAFSDKLLIDLDQNTACIHFGYLKKSQPANAKSLDTFKR